jgi:hypothetical protein
MTLPPFNLPLILMLLLQVGHGIVSKLISTRLPKDAAVPRKFLIPFLLLAFLGAVSSTQVALMSVELITGKTFLATTLQLQA